VVLDADPDRLAQALRNLIDNAIAHTSCPTGHVVLTTTRLAADRIRFTVSDDGPGIAADERELVFDRFHRTDTGRDRNSGGAGLGLAIVQAIATAHGGTIRVGESDLGAQFELELPGCSPPSRAERRPDATLAGR
jgi:two-component system OmpR family sensor kinase